MDHSLVANCATAVESWYRSRFFVTSRGFRFAECLENYVVYVVLPLAPQTYPDPRLVVLVFFLVLPVFGVLLNSRIRCY